MAEPTIYPKFDVFISHNSKDKTAVIALAIRLKDRGIKVWLDIWELRPGHDWQEALEEIITNTHSAAVVVGKDGIGSWENREMRALLQEFVIRRLPVIPVLLPDCQGEPELPLLLRGLTWVDLRKEGDSEAFDRLVWGITGEKQVITQAENSGVESGSPTVTDNFEIDSVNIDNNLLEPLSSAKFVFSKLSWPQLFTGLVILLIVSIGYERVKYILKPVFIEPIMVDLPGGEFWMGSDQLTYLYANELPRHKVNIKPFSIGKYEVTKSEYAAFIKATNRFSRSLGCYVLKQDNWKMDDTKSWNDPGFTQNERHPVVCISQPDAQAYADWLKEKTGKPYRLPTEAEWEYAARAGTQSPWYWTGDKNASNDYAWYQGNSEKGTHLVGVKQPNAFGLFDMAGNAFEWVEDHWHLNYDKAPTDGSAWLDGDYSDLIILRGGSWDSDGFDLRSAYRSKNEPGRRYSEIGFRVALDQTHH